MLIQGRTVIAFELMLSMAVMDELGQDLLCCLFSIDFVQDNEIWMIKTSTLKEDCFTFNHNWSDKRSFVFKVITDMWIDSSHPDIYVIMQCIQASSRLKYTLIQNVFSFVAVWIRV